MAQRPFFAFSEKKHLQRDVIRNLRNAQIGAHAVVLSRPDYLQTDVMSVEYELSTEYSVKHQTAVTNMAGELQETGLTDCMYIP